MGFLDGLQSIAKDLTNSNFVRDARIAVLRETMPDAYELDGKLPHEIQKEHLPGGECALKFKGRFDGVELLFAIVFGAVSIGVGTMMWMSGDRDLTVMLFLLPFLAVSIGMCIAFILNLRNTWFDIYEDRIELYRGIFGRTLVATIPRDGSVEIEYCSTSETNHVPNYSIYVYFEGNKYKINSYHGRKRHVESVKVFLECIFAGKSGSVERVRFMAEAIENEIKRLEMERN